MADKAWLDALSSGEEVAYCSAGWRTENELARVVRRTSTRIIIQRHGRDEWVHAHDGRGPRERGSGFGVPAYIGPMTVEIRLEIERRGLVRFLDTVKWSEQTTDVLRGVRRLLRDAAQAG